MNNKITSPLGFIVVFLVLLGFSLQSCTSAREKSIKEWKKNEWSIVKMDKSKAPTWMIYTRKIMDTNFLEYKIEGNIESSPEACILSFKKDIYNLANGSKSKKYPTYEIVDESKDSLLIYIVHKEPFPFKNTEMSVRYLFSHNAENSTEGVEWKENWGVASIPLPSRKLSRVETFRGSWYFLPTPGNSSNAVNRVQFDPKKMPIWLVEPMIVKFLVGGLDNIREMVSR